MLQFIGRGSAFADVHNCAFFEEEGNLILLDCPVIAFQKIKHVVLGYRNVIICVTHTHGDHVGGIGMLLQYLYFSSNGTKKGIVIAPNTRVAEDLRLLLCRIEGCEKSWFTLQTVKAVNFSWLLRAIPTEHVRKLAGKCFGYHLYIHGTSVVYTGDTASLDAFFPYLTTGTIFYTEIATKDSGVHLFYQTYLPILEELCQKGVVVYLMHLDDEFQIQKSIQQTALQLAPLGLPCRL